MNINITLVIQGLAFFAVAWLVMKFGWPHILAAIEERQRKIAEGLAAADRGQKDLEDAKAKANEIVREARDKALSIVDSASKRSTELVEEAKHSAATEGNRILTAARAEAGVEASRARDELRRDVARLALTGASRVLGREVDAKTHAQLLDELAAQIERR